MYRTLEQRLEEARDRLRYFQKGLEFIEDLDDDIPLNDGYYIVVSEMDKMVRDAKDEVESLKTEIDNRYIIKGYNLQTLSDKEREVMIERLKELVDDGGGVSLW